MKECQNLYCYNNNHRNSVPCFRVPSDPLNPKMYLTVSDNWIICMILVWYPYPTVVKEISESSSLVLSNPSLLICKSIKLKSYQDAEVVVRSGMKWNASQYPWSLPGAPFDVRNHAPIANPTLPIRFLSRGTGNKVDVDWWWASRVGLFFKEPNEDFVRINNQLF